MAVRYETTGLRVIGAMAAGPALGAAIISVDYLWGLYSGLGVEHFQEFGLSKGSGVFVAAYIFWAIGISVVGGPLWLILHDAGWRQPWIAGLGGALAPFCVAFALSTNMFTGSEPGTTYFVGGGLIWDHGVLTAFGWRSALNGAVLYALYGFAVGLLIWRIAYRKA